MVFLAIRFHLVLVAIPLTKHIHKEKRKAAVLAELLEMGLLLCTDLAQLERSLFVSVVLDHQLVESDLSEKKYTIDHQTRT